MSNGHSSNHADQHNIRHEKALGEQMPWLLYHGCNNKCSIKVPAIVHAIEKRHTVNNLGLDNIDLIFFF